MIRNIWHLHLRHHQVAPNPKRAPRAACTPPIPPPCIFKNYLMWIPKGCLVPWSPGTPNNPLPREFKTFLRFSFMSLWCTRYLGVRRPPCSTQGADTEVRRPSHPVALAWALQLMFITNPAPLSAAVGRAEPIVIQVSTEPTTTDLKPGSTEDITYFRWGSRKKEKSHT